MTLFAAASCDSSLLNHPFSISNSISINMPKLYIFRKFYSQMKKTKWGTAWWQNQTVPSL